MRAIAAMACVAALTAACSDDAAETSAATDATTTTATEVDRGVEAANAACDLGDTASPHLSAEASRRMLVRYSDLDPDEVQSMSDTEVQDEYGDFLLTRRAGSEAGGLNDHAREEAVITQEAADKAALAAALDSRFDSLHRGLSNYAQYLTSPVTDSADSGEVEGWFEDIRVGCQRARALR